uniref:N-acetylmuramic acid 6-phosphate etherase n=1 Tax=Zeugodacus cucurbitae TaxID=28588 RepID=A0A0A1X1Y8_ZEUCU
MKLALITIAAVLLCSLLAADAAPPRRRVVRIRVIRIIPIRRRPRDVGEPTGITCEIADPQGIFGDDNQKINAVFDTANDKYNEGNDDLTQEEIAQLCDAVQEHVKQANVEVGGFVEEPLSV